MTTVTVHRDARSRHRQPDHATIARFRQRLEDALAGSFGQVLWSCAKAGMAGVVGASLTLQAAMGTQLVSGPHRQ
jgi:hypothetical protein